MLRRQKRKSILESVINQANNYWQQIAMISLLIILLSFLFPGGKTLLYSYQLNDVSKEEIVAPFNFPILKNNVELQSDLDEVIALEPYLFVRSNSAVNNQIEEINTFFDLTKKIQIANLKLIESRNNLYRERFSKNFNKSRMIVEADSVSLSELKNRMKNTFTFTGEDDKWNKILYESTSSYTEIDLETLKKIIILTTSKKATTRKYMKIYGVISL